MSHAEGWLMLNVTVLELGSEAKGGSRKAMDQLVRQAMPMILSRVARYRPTTFYGDVKSHAMLGFMQGVLHYQEDRGPQLSTYAQYWVDMEVLKCVRAVSLRGVAKPDNPATKRIAGLRWIWDRSRSIEEYVCEARRKYPQVSENDLRALVPLLDNPQETLVDMSYGAPDTEQVVAEAEDDFGRREAMWSALADLPERQRDVIRWTMLEGETLERAGQRLGVTKERVRQLREKGLQKLREHPAVRRADGRDDVEDRAA